MLKHSSQLFLDALRRTATDRDHGPLLLLSSRSLQGMAAFSWWHWGIGWDVGRGTFAVQCVEV